MKRNEQPGTPHEIEPSYGGTVVAVDPDERWLAKVKLEPFDSGSDGFLRLRVREVTVTALGAEAIDSTMWRAVPLGRIENLANEPDNRKLLLDHLHEEIPEQVLGRPRRTRLPIKLPAHPQRGDYGDKFYDRVAVAYRFFVAHDKKPAKEIAADAGVPLSTATRWIREARRRGFLAPAGAKGRTG
jgi:hypothetical protein